MKKTASIVASIIFLSVPALAFAARDDLRFENLSPAPCGSYQLRAEGTVSFGGPDRLLELTLDNSPVTLHESTDLGGVVHWYSDDVNVAAGDHEFHLVLKNSSTSDTVDDILRNYNVAECPAASAPEVPVNNPQVQANPVETNPVQTNVPSTPTTDIPVLPITTSTSTASTTATSESQQQIINDLLQLITYLTQMLEQLKAQNGLQ